MTRTLRSFVCAAAVAFAAGLGAPAETQEAAGARTYATLFMVGDVMQRNSTGTDQVGRLLERLLDDTAGYGRALLLGDLCNDDGAAECYERLEQTSWGPLRPLFYSVPGNHDYQEARRIPGSIPYYFNYVLNGGEREHGWFAFDWGGWRVIALNSELMAKDENNRLSPLGVEQMDWFEHELQENSRTKCVLTAYHRPMFSSGRFASPAWVGPIFRRSYRYGVDLYVTGHEHFFAHLPPLTPPGADNVPMVDPHYGIQGLIAGTGGAVQFPNPELKWGRYGEEVLANEWGVVRIDLAPGAFQWKFIPVQPDPSRVYPSGSGTCHDNPSGYVEPR